jgi:hypothetical protein
MRNEPSTTISFRLLPADVKLLLRAAARGESPGECARRLLLSALSNEERTALLEELTELKGELLGLREKLGAITVALLCDAGKVAKNDAEEFVAEIMEE